MDKKRKKIVWLGVTAVMVLGGVITTIVLFNKRSIKDSENDTLPQQNGEHLFPLKDPSQYRVGYNKSKATRYIKDIQRVLANKITGTKEYRNCYKRRFASQPYELRHFNKGRAANNSYHLCNEEYKPIVNGRMDGKTQNALSTLYGTSEASRYLVSKVLGIKIAEG